MHSFQAIIAIIGINPYVLVPETILKALFAEIGKNKGPIPIKGLINSAPYKQTLVKYSGEWRLYINTTMLKDSPQKIGESIDMTIEIDTEDRTVLQHPKFIKALTENSEAQLVFDSLRPSLQKEIAKYFSFLKTDETIDKNVIKAMAFLTGKGRFIGREQP